MVPVCDRQTDGQTAPPARQAWHENINDVYQ